MEKIIKIAIIEDEKEYFEKVKEYILKFMAEKNECCEIYYFSSASKFLEKEDFYNFIFLDIDLKEKINGMELASIIRQKDQNVIIYFVTNLAQYAINGYEVGAMDYILKPISYPSFSMKLNRGFNVYKNKSRYSIIVSTRNGQVLIDSQNLIYVEVSNHRLTYHTNEGEVSATGTLKGLMEKLKDQPFSLCNQCYLVNLSFVKRIVENTVLVGEKYLQISSPKKKSFISDLNDYLGWGNTLK